ncbi:MAG: hypothetical protein NC293_12290 [Roseburia sp.]|nr:hypothetical protein [Roseburia sp.]
MSIEEFVETMQVIIVIAVVVSVVVQLHFAAKMTEAVKSKGYNVISLNVHAKCFFLPILAVYFATLPDLTLKRKCESIKRQNEELLAEVAKMNEQLAKAGIVSNGKPLSEKDELPDL